MEPIEQLFALQAFPNIHILGFDPDSLDAGGWLMDNLKQIEEPDDWIISGLIERGDQVLLAGAPKAGKSLMASQIALACATGGPFLKWRPPRPMRVAYVNLELRGKRFAARLLRQAGTDSDEVRRTLKVPRVIAEMNACGRLIPIHKFRTLDVLAGGSDFEELGKLLAAIEPDLIVYDVLARLHNEDEMTPAMKRVMKALRDLSGNSASLIVHHTRKPLSDELRPQQAADIRGSSTIHGEIDLALILSRRPGTGARYALNWSARNIQEPDELLLNVTEHLTFCDAVHENTVAVDKAILAAFSGDSKIKKAAQMLEHIKATLKVGRDAAYEAINLGIARGVIQRAKDVDGKTEYLLIDSERFARRATS